MRTGDRAVAIDVGALIIVSAGIVLAARELTLMSILVPAVVAARMLLWSRLPAGERGHGVGFELAFFLLCTAVGGFNDWNSVVRHRLYDYTVPVYRPDLTTIPAWMLLYWGLILRAMATVFAWRRLGLPPPGDELHLPGTRVRSPALRVGFLLALVVATRQLVYVHASDPLWSWLPFAAALLLHVATARPPARALAVGLALLVVGPLIEMLYIRAGLHRYHLGWLGGVPLWICLWWALAALIWAELAARISRATARGTGARRGGSLRAGRSPSAPSDPTRPGSGSCRSPGRAG